MALDEISRLENIQVPAYQVEEQLQQLKDQAKQAGQSDEFDDEQVRKKVESTLERRMVFDFLAEHADLKVEYMKEGEDEFDAELMEKLAQQSLERENASTSEGEMQTENNDVDNVLEPAAEEKEVAVPEAVIEEEKPVVKAAVEEEVKKTEATSFKYDDPEFKDMDQGEKAFNILVDLGMVELHPDPDAPGFDASAYADED
jgi:hypothetical protein